MTSNAVKIDLGRGKRNGYPNARGDTKRDRCLLALASCVLPSQFRLLILCYYNNNKAMPQIIAKASSSRKEELKTPLLLHVVQECPAPTSPPLGVVREAAIATSTTCRANHSSSDDDEAPPHESTTVQRSHNIPHGHWRDGLCDCGNNCSICIVSWIFGTLALGQVMTRMKLGLDGGPTTTAKGHRACQILVSMTVFSTLLYCLEPHNILSTLFGFYVVFLLYRVTRHVQQRYQLPHHHACETVFHVLCCSCCLTARLVRHTANHRKYPYRVCDVRGLSRNAPDHHHHDHANDSDQEILSSEEDVVSSLTTTDGEHVV